MIHPLPLLRFAFVPVLALALASCDDDDDESDPIGNVGEPPRVVACRARVDSPFQFAEIVLRTDRNLGVDNVSERTGTERNVRIHPDGVAVVFAREREVNDPDSRDLFTSSIDGSRPEVRLTSDNTLDDEPCWSPDGSRVLFTSERGGDLRLWFVDAVTGTATPFATPGGRSDSEADWCRATDRIVWSRADTNNHHELWLARPDGSDAVRLTDGGLATGDGTGDRTPSFSPDGSRVVFVRRLAATLASVWTVDVATGALAIVATPHGDAGFPRWAPAGDTIWFGIDEPLEARGTMRLATVPATGGAPTLFWPDERWILEGFDLAADLPPVPAAALPVELDVLAADLQLANGASWFGGRQQLTDADGQELAVGTALTDGRQVAGINLRFDLPVPIASDVLEMRISALARSTRAGADSVLRMSIYNPVDERFDTVVEMPIATTTDKTMSFRTSSLRHVTAERQLRFTVIADIAPGSQCELQIDHVQVEIVTRAP